MKEILNDRAIIRMDGADSSKFLQGLTTNDIIKKTYSYNYLLSNQGRYLFDFFVFKEVDNSYLIDIHAESLDAFLKKITLYKLRSDVKLTDLSEEYSVVYSKEEIKGDVQFSLKDPRYIDLGYRTVVKLLGLENSIDGLYLKDKYEYAIIDGYQDLVYDKSIPIEYGAEELNAIDYQKGCYVGQEVISRAKYQGVVRKKIFKLKFGTEIALIEAGAEITDQNGEKIGKLCSSYNNQAIALLRVEKYLGLAKKLAMIDQRLAEIILPPWRK